MGFEPKLRFYLLLYEPISDSPITVFVKNALIFNDDFSQATNSTINTTIQSNES